MVFIKIVLSLVAAALAGIPTWIFLALRAALNPQGFWEQLAAGVVGWVAFGGLQIACIFLLGVVLVAIWTSGPAKRRS